MKKKHIIILIAGILVIGIGVTVALLLLNNGNSEELIIDPIDAEKYYVRVRRKSPLRGR